MTPVEMAEAAIAADHAHADPAIWIFRNSDEAIRETARTLQAEGRRGRPLWGVPFAVKDNIDVAGMPTTAGCPGFAYIPAIDAEAVRRLLDAGALLLGKTNLDQFATGLVGTRSPYGIPRNVFDPKRVPGGSSSGSACAVAAGIARFSLGTDTAGSGRVPAAFGNIVGVKPTVGSVSARGMVPACRSIDTISVFACSVDEALAVLRVIAGYDVDDPYSREAPLPYLRRGAAISPLPRGEPRSAIGEQRARSRLRRSAGQGHLPTRGLGAAGLASDDAEAEIVGTRPDRPRVAMAAIDDLCEAEVAAAYRRAGEFLRAAAIDISLFLKIADLLYEGPWVAERTAALRSAIDRQPDILYPATRTILEGGANRLAADAFDAFHLLRQARRKAALLFKDYEALLLPAAPFCPTLAEVEVDRFGPNRRLGTFTNFANLCDMAGFAVPIGFSPDGLPIGGVLLGPAWSEGRLAPLADTLHRRFVTTIGATGRELPPPAEPDALAADETALFCIGAHMAGLPLNQQITSLGGRFLRDSHTRPDYRLFALGNRPGMVRSSNGAAIAGEVWGLPTSAIGLLLAQVPPPLGFGTVALDDGQCLGFLAESAGIGDAPDITHLGGWRAWLDAGRKD